MFYNRTSKIVMAWFVCLSPSSYFFFSFFPLPTPKYGAITNSFAKATVLLVIIIRVFKFSTHWWKQVTQSAEETSGAFQAFMDKKSRLWYFPSKCMWAESNRHKFLHLKHEKQNGHSQTLAIPEHCSCEIMYISPVLSLALVTALALASSSYGDN